MTLKGSRETGAIALITVATVLVGCDSAADKVFDAISGRQANIVILSKQPVTLSPAPVTFASAEPLKVLGEWTSVCLVLKDGIPLQPQNQMDKILSEALAGAKVNARLELSDGSRVTLDHPMEAWEHFGRILSHDELSACASARCSTILPRGATVKSIEISADPAVNVRGIYWHSEAGLNEPAAPSASSTARSTQGGQANCSGKS